MVCIFILVKMHARFRIPFVGKVEVCVATNGAAFFGV